LIVGRAKTIGDDALHRRAGRVRPVGDRLSDDREIDEASAATGADVQGC
jgi:hypothetical protein